VFFATERTEFTEKIKEKKLCALCVLCGEPTRISTPFGYVSGSAIVRICTSMIRDPGDCVHASSTLTTAMPNPFPVWAGWVAVQPTSWVFILFPLEQFMVAL
jgi:hypothetical protein